MPSPDLSALFHGTIVVSACEPSADLYAALFIRRIRNERPGLRFVGIGGTEMAGAGVELIGDFKDLMSFGLSAAARNSAGNLAMYRRIARELFLRRPDIFMPVAYPGLNLPLCRYARKLGCATNFLLPPQIWAWGGFRAPFIRRWVDLVISFFPFEYDYYRRSRIPAILMENPLRNHLARYKRTEQTRTIGFMPGSRETEINRNLPVMLKILEDIKADYKTYHFVTILRNKMPLPEVLNPAVMPGMRQRYQVMKNCDFLVTCSGTASLEAAFMNIPQVFFNRPSRLDYYLVRPFLSTKEYNLANLYFGDHRVPALVTRDIRQLIEHIKYALARQHI